ncbi:MAG TPA: penicillin acylase family protein [Pyrinomonadaceae bacterium]|nr:penicillin acylase family protein [Pyrinomonadaceae bacterium]
MNKLRRILLPVLALAFTFSSLPSRSVAQTGTELAVPGLRARVTVRRDERGIPYIEAANDEDLYFAQGYVTASDRLWQMDLQRRSSRGELAEIFGQGALAQDKLHRTFGFARILDEAAAKMPASFALPVNAYTKGVNAYIDSLTDKTLPPEFRILAYKPRRWTAADSLVVAAIMAEYLSSSWQWDMMRASLAGLPKEKREALTPDKSPLDVLVVGKDSKSAAQASCLQCPPIDKEILARLQELRETQRRTFEFLGLDAPALEMLHASNNWVVSGKRTVTGKPLLANDPHIPGSAPGVWYQTVLIAPGNHVAGVTFPGVPGIVIGHNERIAWGATNLGPDVQDVYVEKFDKDNPKRYLTPSGWRDAEVRQELIKVRKGFTDSATDTQTFDVTVTRHGPIVLEKDGNRYALRWTMLDAAALSSSGFIEVSHARNWKEFTTALSQYGGPTQNFVYADVDGHIGYYGAGRIPIRKTGDGSVPYDGSTDEGEWTGFIPFDKLPHLYDPPSGMIVTANQRVAGTSYPYLLGHTWATPYRARRILTLLSEKPKLNSDDFRRIQSDVYSIGNVTFARAAAKTLKAAAPDDKLLQVIADFETWDGMLRADSRVAVIVSQTRAAFRTRILSAALGPELAKTYTWPESEVLLDRLIIEQPADWLPKEFPTYADLLKASYTDARENLTKSLEADDAKWSWGGLVKSRFNHPLAAAPLIGLQFTIAPFPQNGTGALGTTVNVGSSVSMRFIADPSDWDKTLNVVPLGVSGLPSSPHWKDQLEDWRNGTTRALPFSKEAIHAATKEILILTPKG